MSNNRIYGIGESNAAYQNKMVLWKMKLKALLKNKEIWTSSKIFVDQINHNKKTPNLNLINHPKSKVIFLVRNPNDAIQSILKLTKDHYTPWPVDKVINYYNERLTYLLMLIELLGDSSYFILRSEDLVEKTDQTLNELTQFLNLQNQLSPNYNLFSFSGIHGDPSKTIKEQKIVAQKVHSKLDEDISSCQNLYDKIIAKKR